MSKKRFWGITIMIIILTAVTTYTLTYYTGGGRVLISADQYEYYKELEKTGEKLISTQKFIEKNYYKPLDSEKIQEGALKGMFEAIGDPYSRYMNAEEFSEVMIETTGEYSGIGVTIVPTLENEILVIAPIEDTPAQKAGIQSGDVIVKIDDVAYTAETLDEAVANMRGKPGTSVKVTVLRAPGEYLDFDILRKSIQLKTVKSELLEDKIGYIRITSFDQKTDEEFGLHLRELLKKDAQSLIIDLRDNPGGLVDECVKIADRLLGKGDIIYTENQQGERSYETSDSGKIDIPYVLLVNGGTASSAEILTAAVQDHEGGQVIGTNTFGKGIIQIVVNAGDGAGMELTVAQYFSPDGNIIHGVGIAPDIEVEMDTDQWYVERDEDVQFQKAVEVLNDYQ